MVLEVKDFRSYYKHSITERPSSMDKMEKTTEKKKGFVREFTAFLQAFGVIGLAIGFVIGVASSAAVNSLVNDLINPIVRLVLPTGTWRR
jgi:hypothetical protein